MKKHLFTLSTIAACLLGNAHADSSGNSVFWNLTFKDPILAPQGSLIFEQLSPGSGPEGEAEIKAIAMSKGGTPYTLEDLGGDSQTPFLKCDSSRKSYLFVRCPEDTGIERDDYSLALWIKPAEEPSGYLAINRTISPYWGASLNPEGKIVVAFNGYPAEEAHGKTMVIHSKSGVNPNEWNHIAVVVDRNQSIIIYLNGQLETISKSIVDHNGAMSPTLHIGGGYDPYLSGQLGSVTFYRGKLSEAEVEKLAANKPGSAPAQQ